MYLFLVALGGPLHHMICNPPPIPYLGADIQTNLASVAADFAFIGIPYGIPYGPQGLHSDAGNAPKAIRERSARFTRHDGHYDFDLGGTTLGGTGVTWVDCGDVAGSTDVNENARRATDAVGILLSRGAVPIIFGGDDSVPPLCVSAFEHHGPVNVLQIDAHIDFRDVVHGVRGGYSSTIRRIREMPWVHRIVQVGARGTGSARPQDYEDALKAGNIIVPAEQVHDEGISCVTSHFSDDLPWFVTIDIDGLDPTIAPGTGAPLPGGLSFHQARGIFKHLASRCQLAGVDVVEHLPSLDVRDTTSLTITRLLINVMGFAARRGLKRTSNFQITA
jgi:agmatinase